MRRLSLIAFNVLVIAFLFTTGELPGTATTCGGGVAVVEAGGPTPPGAFQGCWSRFSSGTICEGIYRDAQNRWFNCGRCGPQGQQPNPTNCRQIDPNALNTGFWCS